MSKCNLKTCKRDGWIPTSVALPELDVPVWMYLPEHRQMVIGCRSDEGKGWRWYRCNDVFWSDGTWKGRLVEDKGDTVKHWKPLPFPPDSDSEHPLVAELDKARAALEDNQFDLDKLMTELVFKCECDHIRYTGLCDWCLTRDAVEKCKERTKAIL